MNKVRPMLHRANLDNRMWGFAVLTACYLMNRSPTTAVDTTPAEMWYGHKPDLKNLQEFGLVVYTKNLGRLMKLDDRGQKGIFVGYAPNGVRVWNPKTRRVYLARDVKFTDHFDMENKIEGSVADITIESLTKFVDEENRNEDEENRNENEERRNEDEERRDEDQERR